MELRAAENFPGGHITGNVESTKQACPLGQSIQVFEDKLKNVPDSHVVQNTDPISLDLPTGQFEHTLEPSVPANLPLRHDLHVLMP